MGVVSRGNDLIGLTEVSVQERGDISMPVNAIQGESYAAEVPVSMQVNAMLEESYVCGGTRGRVRKAHSARDERQEQSCGMLWREASM